jgi:hypothetical protein
LGLRCRRPKKNRCNNQNESEWHGFHDDPPFNHNGSADYLSRIIFIASTLDSVFSL